MTSRSESARWWAATFVVSAALSGLACDRGATSTAPSASAPAVELSPVPEPSGFVAELHAPRPEELWSRTRELIGGPALLLPSSFPLLVGTLLGLPPTAAVDVDGAVPVHAAIVEHEGAPAWVGGFHVRSGAELVAKLSLGAEARYEARLDVPSGVHVLTPRPGRAAPGLSLGVVGNYLLAAPGERALLHAGPFVARTLPSRPARAESLVAVVREPALRSSVAPGLRRQWQERRAALETLARGQREAKGAPDFADPGAALAVAAEAADTVAAWLESATEIALSFEPRADHAELRVVATPAGTGAARDAVQGMLVGDTVPLLRLPSESAVAFLVRSRPDATADTSAWGARLRRLFGERLPEKDAGALEEWLRPWFAARGERAAWALLADERAPGLVGLVETRDAVAVSASMKGLPRAVSTRAIAAPLERWAGLRRVRHATLSAPAPVGRYERVSAVFGAPAGASGPPSGPKERTYELAWLAVKPEEGWAALGPLAEPLLRALQASASGAAPALGGDAAVRAALGRLDHPVAVAVVVRTDRLGLGTGEAPSLLTLGRTEEGAAVGRLELSRELLGVLARLAVRR